MCGCAGVIGACLLATTHAVATPRSLLAAMGVVLPVALPVALSRAGRGGVACVVAYAFSSVLVPAAFAVGLLFRWIAKGDPTAAREAVIFALMYFAIYANLRWRRPRQ